MKPAFLYLIPLFFFLAMPDGAGRKKKRNYRMTEQDMVAEVVSCLKFRDAHSYTMLFPSSDSLAYWIMEEAGPGTPEYERMAYELEHPAILFRKDSVISAGIREDFERLTERGDQMGITWQALILSRYELVKMPRMRDTVYEKLSPERFRGYFFVVDRSSAKSYGIAVQDIMKIRGGWYGGHILNIYMASTVDEYLARQAVEAERIRKGEPGNLGLDSLELPEQDEGEIQKERKQVVERRFYLGRFDDEVDVTLYIRALKGDCPEEICSWEGLFRFGDQEEYDLLEITREEDGTWRMEEESGLGVMELLLEGDTYRGTWMSVRDRTEYEAEFRLHAPTNKTKNRLDALLDTQQ